MNSNRFKLAAGLTGALLLAACGGNNTEPNAENSNLSASRIMMGGATSTSTSTSTAGVGATATGTLSAAAAAQFLNLATFGANDTAINELTQLGKAAWMDAQFTKPQIPHRTMVGQSVAALAAGTPPGPNLFYESFWKQAIKGDDQLRQRVTYALSQIFVVSLAHSNLYHRETAVADYYDTLGRYAFGNFRDLLQAVALHPAMGIYLSHMHNQKEAGARVPDENFAREIMQLMTIGLYHLNIDGGVKTYLGQPIPTYSHDDVAGLAKVFTGWSWAGPDRSSQRFFGNVADTTRDWTPMQIYPDFHSSANKTFLGKSTNGSGEADLKVALDTLFNHPNVGPFIGRQLIQRLVTSNPAPSYVARVATVFANNGSGVRGDMRAVLRAILLDPEATDSGRPKKLREPVLRLANWMRGFNVQSASGRFMMGNLDDPLTGLGQTPMYSPSVFNFYRPSYSPPNTALSAAKLVAPEMQITSEPSVTGYLNCMQAAIATGAGIRFDIQANYANELALAATPDLLIDRVQTLLMGGGMSTTLRNSITSAVNAIEIPIATGKNPGLIENARKNRVYMAIFLTMASPEYLAQR